MADCLLGNVNDNYKGMCVKIINFFIGKGLTPAQALGICANVYKESTYKPNNENPSSKAYGLFQWSPHPTSMRRQPFEKYCRENNGGVISDPDIQLRYCWHENFRDFTNYYLSHKDMTARQSLLWWQNNWEICDIPSTSKDECDTKTREKELTRLENLYNSNVKTNNCNVNVDNGSGGDSSSEEVVCPPTTVSGSDKINEGTNGSSSDSSNSYGSSGSNEGQSPDTSSIIKPVIFGGSWAYFMSQYLCKNGDCLSYAQVWQNPTISKSDKKAKYFGELSTNQQAERVSTIDTIKDYLSKNTAPNYIIVSIDLAGEWRFEESWQKNYTPSNIDYIIQQNLSNKLKKFFAQINHQKVFVPLLVESYCNEVEFCKVRDNNGNVIKVYKVSYTILNSAILHAAKNFKNIKVLNVRRVSNMGVPWRLPSNGYNSYFRQEQWEEYAKNVQDALLQNL